MLDVLRQQAEYVVIEAPSTASSADAQSLASLADAAILAVELRRSRRPALLDAAEQLQRVGTPLLGAVVLPRLSSLRVAEVAAPAVTLPPQANSADLVVDADLTQPMRFPTNTLSSAEKAAREKAAKAANERTAPNAQVRPRTAGPANDVTAVLDMSGLVKEGAAVDGAVTEGTQAEDGDGK
jgi:hypothetical protein